MKWNAWTLYNTILLYIYNNYYGYLIYHIHKYCTIVVVVVCVLCETMSNKLSKQNWFRWKPLRLRKLKDRESTNKLQGLNCCGQKHRQCRHIYTHIQKVENAFSFGTKYLICFWCLLS